MSRWLGCVLGLVCVTTAARAESSAPDDGQRRALVVLRVLSFDRNLASRSGATVRVLLSGRESDCGADGEAFRATATGRSVLGRPVETVARAMGSPAAWSTLLREIRPAAVVFCSPLGADAAEYLAATRKAKVLSFTHTESDVHQGVTFGVVQAEKKLSILVNLSAAKAEGADIDSALMRIAKAVPR